MFQHIIFYIETAVMSCLFARHLSYERQTKHTQRYIIWNEMRKYDRYVRHPAISFARASTTKSAPGTRSETTKILYK